MKNNIKNLTSGKEKLVKYAVIQASISKNIDNEILNIDNIYCDKHHIFDSEDLADQFCDHANKIISRLFFMVIYGYLLIFVNLYK